MSQALVANPDRIRIAMLGMVPGNGHPFSWSAILNGRYDSARIAAAGYPVISDYLNAQPREALGVPGVEVTHVWCDDAQDTQRVANACGIAHRLERPEDAIGQVDAVIVATDIGHEHVARVSPFIEADVPVFIDKPLTDRLDHLQQFIDWNEEGKRFMSSSAMRYSPPLVAMRDRLDEVGELRMITLSMCKSWEAYGIHALEAVYPLLRPGGWESVRNAVEGNANIVHIHHADGVEVLLPTIKDMAGAFGRLGIYGTKGHLAGQSGDTFNAFKTQLLTFIDYLHTGNRPVPFEHLVEQMQIIIAGIQSKENSGRPVMLSSLQSVSSL